MSLRLAAIALSLTAAQAQDKVRIGFTTDMSSESWAFWFHEGAIQ